jgi:hypothetical protein
MRQSFRLQIVEPLTLGGYLILLVVGAHLESREGWIGTLSAITVLAFFAWVMSMRRGLAITDTPTSRIASAAQGYVELIGSAVAHPTTPLLSKLTGLPCCWYRFEIMRRTSNNKWEHVDSGVSTESFLLDDGSAQCVVDPEFAEVIPKRKDTWMQDDHRLTEWLILPKERVYAIGQFSTVGGANTDLDFNRDLSWLLAQWKLDKTRLLARFDLDGDGNINEDEWLLARQQAKREIRKQHREVLSQAGTHVMHKPADGRLFLISNINPEKLAARYRLWTVVHLAIFFVSVATTWWLTQQA